MMLKFTPSGSCIQLGIGGLPNIVGTMLSESDVKDLGCHTEMLVDAYYHMHEAGKLTNRMKGIDKNKFRPLLKTPPDELNQ